jgi:dihydrofolate reductase
LGGRTNIVISRDPSFAVTGVLAARSLSTALDAARGDALRRGCGEIAVIGGADVYAQAMPLADRLEITWVHADTAGDTVFPRVDPARWRESARREQAAATGDDASMTFATYLPITAAGGVGSLAL